MALLMAIEPLRISSPFLHSTGRDSPLIAAVSKLAFSSNSTLSQGSISPAYKTMMSPCAKSLGSMSVIVAWLVFVLFNSCTAGLDSMIVCESVEVDSVNILDSVGLSSESSPKTLNLESRLFLDSESV